MKTAQATRFLSFMAIIMLSACSKAPTTAQEDLKATTNATTTAATQPKRDSAVIAADAALPVECDNYVNNLQTIIKEQPEMVPQLEKALKDTSVTPPASDEEAAKACQEMDATLTRVMKELTKA